MPALNPVFVEAGKLAFKMQKDVSYYNKHNTGSPTSDIVTEADFAVQEFLLQEMIKTGFIKGRYYRK
jgi:hypothetical protein